MVIGTCDGFTLSVARTPAELDVAAAIRYRAYRATGALPESASARFLDAFDQAPDARTVLVWHGDRPVAATRTLVSRDAARTDLTAALAFGDVIREVIPPHAVVIEANRFVVDPDVAGMTRRAIWPMIRANLMRCAFEEGDYFVAALRPAHLAFYARVLRLSVASEERVYPGLRTGMHLMTADLHTQVPLIMAEFTALKATHVERAALFGEVSRVHPDHQHTRPGL